jgi:hypothetical protein
MDDVQTHIQHADVLIMQAEITTGQVRQECLEEATDALLRAEKLAPGSGSYKLACIHARAGNHSLCLRWLERARDRAALPAASDLRASSFFTGVHSEGWFEEFVRSL